MADYEPDYEALSEGHRHLSRMETAARAGDPPRPLIPPDLDKAPYPGLSRPVEPTMSYLPPDEGEWKVGQDRYEAWLGRCLEG